MNNDNLTHLEVLSKPKLFKFEYYNKLSRSVCLYINDFLDFRESIKIAELSRGNYNITKDYNALIKKKNTQLVKYRRNKIWEFFIGVFYPITVHAVGYRVEVIRGGRNLWYTS